MALSYLCVINFTKTRKTMETKNLEAQVIMTPEELLSHWQGHRKLTRRVIEAFPEDKLFTYSVGGMRPFAELALEMLHMAEPGLRGIVTRQWENYGDSNKTAATTKKELLALWDKATQAIDTLWPQIPEGRFHEIDKAFGMWEGPMYWSLFYFIDNEIHHRAQGYVYLRSLGIEPPPFWER
jgi:uncharacterized damage-inducible protein DinB